MKLAKGLTPLYIVPPAFDVGPTTPDGGLFVGVRGSSLMRWVLPMLILAALAGCSTNTTDDETEGGDDSTPTTPPTSPPASPDPSSPPTAPPTTPSSAPPEPEETGLGDLFVRFVDVGQGAAVIIQLPDAVIVNDAGRNSATSATAIKNELQDLGVAAIDALIISNPDADHAGGCDDLYAAYDVQ